MWPQAGWVSKDVGIWKFLYDYAPIPAFCLAGGALITIALSFRIAALRAYRKVALFFILVLAIGPGLIVNTFFKEHWGRPRPRHIQEFSGKSPFLRVWEKGNFKNGNSFPSGHASVGFFLLSPYFILRKRSRYWALTCLSFGIGCGTLIGLARMIQGGHFASDVLWAGGVVYFTAVGVFYGLRLHRQPLLQSQT